MPALVVQPQSVVLQGDMAPFREAGLTPLSENDLGAAADVIRKARPAVLVLPIEVRGVSALPALATWLHNDAPPVTVLIADSARMNDAAEAMRLGVFDCLFRPYSTKRLTKTLRRAADLARQQAAASGQMPGTPAPAPPHGAASGETLAEIERQAIEAAIEAAGGNVTRAAQVLDVAPSTLYRKLRLWSGKDPA